MDFVPKGKQEEALMLKEIGVNSVNDLFNEIPDKIKSTVNIGKALSEQEVITEINKLVLKNKNYQTSFLGAGSYHHYIPSLVGHLAGRSEFYTAYTPYQPEMSQGILQAIFEYQTMICRLTGMEVSNASLYDGAEALAEAAIISVNKSGRDEIIISKAVHPEYRETVKTYLDARDKKMVEIDFDNGKTSIENLKKTINEKTAGIIIQSPNFLGLLEDIEEISKIAHENNSLLTVGISDPTCLGLLKSPGDLGADLVAFEGQSLGSPRNFGGPYLGVIAAKKDLMRYVPGRIVGETVDKEGTKGYLLTLQAREQHIRREKAACNICSNQALVALSATIYMAALGKEGFKEVANLNIENSHYMHDKLKKYSKFDGHFYNEFVMELTKEIREKLEKNGIEPGLDLGKFYPDLKNCSLICVTEMNSKEDIDKFVELL